MAKVLFGGLFGLAVLLSWSASGCSGEVSAGDLDENLVAYYPFDEVRDGITPDGSGSGLDAEVVGDKPAGDLLAEGVYGLAMRFEAGWEEPYACVRLPLDERLQLRESFTICFWIKPLEGSTGYIVTNTRWGDNCGYLIRFGHRRIYLKLGFEDGIKTFSSPANSVQVDSWSHVAVVFDGEGAAIFINGEKQSSLKLEEKKSLAAPSYSHWRTTVGAHLAPRYYRFTGFLDDLRFYDRALSREEIAAVMFMN